MKTMPISYVLELTQNCDKATAIADSIIQSQVFNGLHDLERRILDNFARAKGCWTTEECRKWRGGYDADEVRTRIHECFRTMLGGY